MQMRADILKRCCLPAAPVPPAEQALEGMLRGMGVEWIIVPGMKQARMSV